jgi:hypothetical protein
MTPALLSLWTVYWSPNDYLNQYVARRWEIGAGPEPRATTDMFVANSIVELRRLIPSGLMNLPRFSEDDPCIVEVWI